MHTGADLTRARELLDFEPTTSLGDGLAADVDWIRERGAGEDQAGERRRAA